MQVANNMVVTIDYTLTDNDGTVLDSSDGGEPLAYLHGQGNIIVGLEEALEGLSAGDAVDVTVLPEKAYGERRDDLIQVVPRERFVTDGEIEVGMTFHSHESDNGGRVVRVVEVSPEQVTIDGNHPLAGVTLNFSVRIQDVREASAEELDHGHVHGPGTHHH
ncbi:MAG: peptidylprolyl isomerase [Gammaproteobacteria bacterium]|nr:peptidylprolyl isomerase [Gammaproteobacteria bacterium]